MVFLIGGRGFVGSAFARLLTRLGVEHEVIDVDNYDRHVGRRCDVLINANGNSKKFLADRDAPAEFDASVRSVQRSLHDFKFERYVHCSTADVYNNTADPSANREDAVIRPAELSRYGFHKHLAEQLVRYEARDWLVVRFSGFVGPGLKKNAVYDILHGGPLWLDPSSRLQFIHTDAAAEIVWSLAGGPITREIVNVCGDGLVALREIIDFTGKPVAVQPGSPVITHHINNDRLKGLLAVPATRETVRAFVEGRPA